MWDIFLSMVTIKQWIVQFSEDWVTDLQTTFFWTFATYTV